MAKTTVTTTTPQTTTEVVPRVQDRKLYAKFEIPFATGKTSAIVYIPLADVTPGTTVTLSITKG